MRADADTEYREAVEAARTSFDGTVAEAKKAYHARLEVERKERREKKDDKKRSCCVAAQGIRQEATLTVAELEAKRDAERRELDAIKCGKAWGKAADKSRAKPGERLAEANERIVSEIEAERPELVGLWHRHGRSIRATDRKTRVEAFWEWVEENPDEVTAYLDSVGRKEERRFAQEAEAYERDKQRARGAPVAEPPRTRPTKGRGRGNNPTDLSDVPF